MSNVTVLRQNYWARVHEIARANGVMSSQVIYTLRTLGHFTKSASSRVFALPTERDAIVDVIRQHTHTPNNPEFVWHSSDWESSTCRCGERIYRIPSVHGGDDRWHSRRSQIHV